jgi:glycosyltransferase involved in cell wall biosynthesis
MGQRFSGIDWHNNLMSKGWDIQVAVGNEKKSDLQFVTNLFKNSLPRKLHNLLVIIERKTGHQSQLAFWTRMISRTESFKNSDLIHYQVIHDGGWFRIESLKHLSKKLPSIWTLHDAWAVTGHCIQPLDCKRFAKGCDRCPNLDWPMPVHVDRSKSERIRKRKVLANFSGTIHVSTHWMETLVRNSGVSKEVRIEVIPFGIDQDIFNPGNQRESRRKVGIDEQGFVIGCRSTDWAPKNFRKLYEAVNSLADKGLPITILTVNEYDLFLPLIQKYPNLIVKDLGWLDARELVNFYRAIDLFAAVSTGESFGFMPLEAAACGAAVICLENGAIAELVAPAAPMLCVQNSSRAIAEAIDILANDHSKLEEFKANLLHRVRTEYSLPIFTNRLTDMYEAEIARKLKDCR